MTTYALGPLALLALVILIGLVLLLIWATRRRPWIIAVVAGVVLLGFAALWLRHGRPVERDSNLRGLRASARLEHARRELKSDGLHEWQDAAFWEADVYPTREAAVEGLARHAARQVDRLAHPRIGTHRAVPEVTITVRALDDTHDEVYARIGSVFRGPQFADTFDKLSIIGWNEARTLWEPGAAQDSLPKGSVRVRFAINAGPGGGRVSYEASGFVGSPYRQTARFVDKPWVIDASGYRLAGRAGPWIVGRSGLAATRQGAHEEAKQAALAPMGERVRDEVRSRGPLTPQLAERLDELIDRTLAAEVRRAPIISDAFVQEIDNTAAGRIYRAAVLWAADEVSVRPISDRMLAQMQAWERTIWYQLASVGVLGVLIVLAYLFLDAGTRGHFTWPLRIMSASAFVGVCLMVWYFGPRVAALW